MRRSLWRGLRTLLRPRAAAQDLEDELQHFVDQTTQALISQGMSPEEAVRTARLEVGNLTVVQEQVRESGWESGFADWLTDLRHAARRLRHSPGFSGVNILTIALGVGAAAAIWSVVRPILFDPLPYPDAHRILAVWDRGTEGARMEVTFGTYRELTQRSRGFEAMAVTRMWQPTLTGPAEPERLVGQRVSHEYFRVLGIPPAIGRDFQSADDVVAGPAVVILGHSLWRRRFQADPEITGRLVMLDDSPYTVIGIMPEDFENVVVPGAEVWTPLQYDASLPPNGREWGHHLRMIARARPGTDPSGAETELGRIARSPLAEMPRVPWAALENGFLVTRLQDDITRGVRPALLAILGAVLLVLVIAGINVSAMFLARGARRQGELALRVALGAGRLRLVRQILAESVLLALAGGGLGVLLARTGVVALVSLAPAGLPRVEAVRLDGGVFILALAVVVLLGLVVGLIPAFQAARVDPVWGWHSGNRTISNRHHTIRRGLVVAEVALAMILLVGSGLLLRSLQRIFAISPGFESRGVLAMQVHASGHRYDDATALHQFFQQALHAVRQVPGVEAAGFTSQLPLSGDLDRYGVQFESAPTPPGDEGDGVFRYGVTPGYIEALGIPLISGRLLDEGDRPGAPVAVLISQSFARRRFPDRDPVGQRLHVGRTDQPWYTIVGVVGDVRQTALGVEETDAVYLPAQQWYAPDRVQSLVVRARGNAAALTPAVRNAIWSVDKDQAITRVVTMNDLLTQSEAERRFALVLLQSFALVALALAAIGIYGVVSGGVTERVREIGVRSALGASRTGILSLVVRQGMTLAGLGIGLGLAAALGASRGLEALLFGVSRLDPLTYLSVAFLSALVALAATAIPARRASRVDPVIALRAE